MTARPPVSDWATDFDHLDPRWVNDPYPIWDEMRGTCPIAHTERFRACTFPRATRTCARSPTTPSISPRAAWSCANSRRRACLRRRSRPIRRTTAPARMVLLPPFTPEAIDQAPRVARPRDLQRADRQVRRQGRLRRRRRLRAGASPCGSSPTCWACRRSDGDLFRKWIHEILEDGHHRSSDDDARLEEMHAVLRGRDRGARKAPGRRPDQLSGAADLHRRAAAAPRRTCSARCGCMLVAGIDTTWSGIGSCIWHLATHSRGPPAAGRRARADADGHRGVPARLLARDHGARGGEGDADQRLHRSSRARWCCCRSRPPTAIPRCSRTPTRSIIDRKENRHAAFGLGIHRCIGSNLARMEMTVAVEELLKRIPEFSSRRAR